MKTAKIEEWTYEEFMALPEGGPYRDELIDGELCMTPAPSPRHQEISWNLSRIIGDYLYRNPGRGKAFTAPCDGVFSQHPPQVVEPDLIFVSQEHLSLIGEENIQGVPDLLVEILSEGTVTSDRRIKPALSERFGVPGYWIVDPEAETVQVFRLVDGHYAPALEFGIEDRLETPLLPGLSIPLSEVFPA